MKASLAKSDPRSLIGYSAIYIILGAFSFSTAYVQANTATVWLPSGFAVGLLISRGARCWPAVSLGSLLLNVGVGFFSSVQVSVTTLIGSATFIAFGNTLEALLGCALARHLAGGDRLLSRARNIVVFALTGATLPPVLSTSCGILASRYGGFSRIGSVLEPILTWYAANAVGILILVGPVIATFARTWRACDKKQVPEACLLVASLIFASQTMIGVYTGPWLHDFPRPYMIIPLLLWASFRFGTSGALVSTLIVAAISIVGTMHGFSVFPAESSSRSLIYLQLFLGMLSLTALSISASLEEVADLQTGLEAKIEARTSEVQDLLRSRQIFTTLVAHDLQSPLYGVRNALRATVRSIELRKITRLEVSEALSLMETTCSALATRIFDLLNLEASYLPSSNRTVTPLADIIKSLEKAHRLTLQQKKVEIQLHASREVTVFWSNKVEHILDNLISNSLKYGSAEKPIIVSAYKHGATVEILLTDSGPGIQDSVMNGLFRPDMQRTGSARSGRGLYLASEQADEIGGRLTYLRNEESGSTFRLILPC